MDIIDEIEHLEAVIDALHKNRRVLDLQIVRLGVQAPPHMITEMASITEQIRIRESELMDLKSRSVEGSTPLFEVEYRAIAAEVWNTPRGLPSVVGSTKLDLERLRLGISVERASQIEQDIRRALVQEMFCDINFHEIIETIVQGEGKTIIYKCIYFNHENISLLGRAVRLDPITTIEIIVDLIQSEMNDELRELPVNHEIIQEQIFAQNRIRDKSNDWQVFSDFTDNIITELRKYFKGTLPAKRIDLRDMFNQVEE